MWWLRHEGVKSADEMDFAVDDFEVVCEVAVKCWRLNNRMKQRFFKIGNEMTEYERVLGFIRQHGE